MSLLLDKDRVEYAGDARHPDHNDYLLELGKATYASMRLVNIVFNILRVHASTSSSDLYDDVLGRLVGRLKSNPPDLPGVREFIERTNAARLSRNDLIHALPVKHGLHRRKSNDPSYVRNFYTVESLTEVCREFDEAAHLGNILLYSDGGVGVRQWYKQ